MKKTVAVFDMDGTILDTLEDLKNSVNFALSAVGFPERSLDEVKRFVGNGIGKLVERSVPAGTSPKETERVLAKFRAYYGEHCADHTRPYANILTLLTELRKRGIRTAVVSNKADFAVQQLCQDYFLQMFDVAVGERADVRRKPAPDLVYEVLERLQVTAESAYYIGDSDVDLETADNAGMDCIAVAWGFRGRKFLEEHGAKNIVDEAMQILEYF